MNLPTMRQLQYLVAVIETRHFAHAAERCFVTQSTLSLGIRELESLLGVPLLERTKRKVLPTPMGLQLADMAGNILSLAVQMVEQAGAVQRPLAGPLKLGVIPTIGPFLLPRVLPEIRRRYKELELYLIEDQTSRLLAALNKGEIDAAILALPYDLGPLERSRIWQESFWVAMPRQHQLASRKSIKALNLPPEQLLLLEEGHCMHDHVLSACKLKGLQPRGAFQGTSLYTLVEMVVGGQGITLLPAMALNTALTSHRELTLLPLAEAGPHRDISLVWRASYFRKADLKLLAEEILALLTAQGVPH